MVLVHVYAEPFAQPGLVFDVLISDAPYSKRVHEGSVSPSASGGRSKGVKKREYGFDHLSPALRSEIALAASRVRRWSVIFSDMEGATWWRLACEARGVRYIRTVPWTRWSKPNSQGDGPPPGAESVLLFHPQGKKEWNGRGNLTHFEELALRGAKKYSAEKPLDLCLRLVSWFSRPGETILVPTAGSGTVLQAARLLGRHAIGFEPRKDIAALANARITGPLSESERERCARFIDEETAELIRLQAQCRDKPQLALAFARAGRGMADVDFLKESLRAVA